MYVDLLPVFELNFFSLNVWNTERHSLASARNLGVFVWQVPCRLPWWWGRDGERSLWIQFLRRFAHHRSSYKLFGFNILGGDQ